MKRDKSGLQLLLVTVDNWFSDDAYRIPLTSNTECTLDNDQAKLAQINKTTLRWFSSLTDALTNEGIEDQDDNPQVDGTDTWSDENTCNITPDEVISQLKVVRKRNTRKSKAPAGRKKSKPKNKQNIDELAKDLERILDEADEISTPSDPQIEYFHAYFDNELALLDETIGASYTLPHGNSNPEPDRAAKWSSLTDNSKSVCRKLSPPRTRKKFRNNNYLQLRSNSDFNKVQTPCPLLDHDYLPRIPVKPLVLNNRLIRCSKQSHIALPVLNVSALRKFARFSDQFRQITMEHDKILAICNE